MKRRPRSEAGNATVIALLATLLLSGLAAGLASVSFGVNRTGAALDNSVLAGYAAEAGLEHVRAAVSFAAEDPDLALAGNPWLNASAIAFDAARVEFPGQLDDPVIPELRVGTNADRQDVWCDVWVYAMDDDGKKYRMVARGWTGAYTEEDGRKVPKSGQSVSVLLAQDFRARDTFARFATFVDKGTLRFGKTTVAGDVHSNDHIEFHYGGAKFLDRVTAVNNFSFRTGASEAKTSFRDQNRFAPRIELPTVTDVNAFGEFAAGAYRVSGENAAYPSGGEMVDAQIELKGNEVRVVAIKQTSHEVISDVTLPLPPDGVIYVQGNVRSIQGEVSGRLTISTPGKMNVTGDIVYTDGAGHRAMRLERDGVAVDPASLPEGTDWKEEDGFRYVKNPEFTLEGDRRPALGLMAGHEISLDGSGPENLEIHGAMFSATSNWRADLKVKKGNLRILGSITTSTPGERAQGKKGYAGSGEYIYDDALLENPPPHWLEVYAPFWGPRWRIGW